MTWWVEKFNSWARNFCDTSTTAKTATKKTMICAVCSNRIEADVDRLESHLADVHGGMSVETFYYDFVLKSDMDDFSQTHHFEEQFDFFR